MSYSIFSSHSSSTAKLHNLTMTSSLPSATAYIICISDGPSKKSKPKSFNAKPPSTNTIIPKEWSFNKDLQIQNPSSNPDDDINRAVCECPSSIHATNIPVVKEDCGWNNIEVLSSLKVERVTYRKPWYIFIYTYPFTLRLGKRDWPLYPRVLPKLPSLFSSSRSTNMAYISVSPVSILPA